MEEDELVKRVVALMAKSKGESKDSKMRFTIRYVFAVGLVIVTVRV
jgi:hypothetical protein